ncbi:MAG: transcriptional repressor [Anaerolineae bacterium]|nr:MAG: transcriptional repressor [Anaerolineae bacterium]
MANLIQLLHKTGYKYTKPRQLVSEVLESHAEHLSANEIWEAVSQLDPTIGRMSVYRTLDLFTQLGYIRPATRNAADIRNGIVYVMMHDGHHHHIICQNCGQVIEFEDCNLDKLVETLEKKYNCRIGGHLLEFFGVCDKCLRVA